MKFSSCALLAKVAALLIAALPLAAQSPDMLRQIAHTPLVHVDVAPDVAAPGFAPASLMQAYSFLAVDVKKKGKGQTIALIDAYDDPNAEADLATFNTQFALPACTTANGCFKLIYANGTQPPADTIGWSNETAIDIQWAHAIAPAANIIHFNVPGVTFVAATGDTGHGVSYPAASPYVVAVGGTTLTINADGSWASETAWSGSGGGSSKYEIEPSYQTAVQSTGQRTIPDVSYDGDPNTGVPSYSSYVCGACKTGWLQWGGTSIGTPQWAALFAIANSIRVYNGKATLTQPQLILYPIGETYYHDITSGTNGSCGRACTAATGYDLVTGLGSPIGHTLIHQLISGN